ncbi:MAG: tetratricopeptide repeat protein [Alistipes sp.]|nr:tetratricopeptide repeat protein [Alistipes sp.]
MRKNILIALLVLSSICLADSVQQGCVKTRGRMINGKHVPGQGLPGSIVSIKDRTAIGVKNNNGTFSFPVTDNQFRVDSVKKKDYVLLDADAASKTYIHTADTLFFVMETPEQLWEDRYSAERRFRDELSIKLKAREREVDSLLKVNAISQEEYRQTIQKIYAEQEDNQKLISDMAERYSKLDYDQMDEFYRQVSYCIEECEFVKADSLLKTRGNLQAQIESALQTGQLIDQKKAELSKAESVHQHDIDELAKRCYSYYENFKMQYQNDSAAYFLELRSNLDSTNVLWLIEMAGFICEYCAKYDASKLIYERALQVLQNEQMEKYLEYEIGIYNNLGHVCELKGDFDKALSYCNKAINKCLLKGETLYLATIYNTMGSIYSEQNKYDVASEYYKKSLDIRLEVYGENHEEVAVSYNNIGDLYQKKGKFSEALEYFEKALKILQNTNGEQIYIAATYNNIATIYSDLDKFAEAIEYYKIALDIRLRILGEFHPDVALSYNNIGGLYREKSMYNEAMEYYKKALCVYERMFPQHHYIFAILYNNLATTYKSLSQFQKSLDYFLKSLSIRKKIYGDNSIEVGILCNNLGDLYSRMMEYEKSIEYYTQALIILKEQIGEHHPVIATLYSNISTIYNNHYKDYNKALDYLRKAMEIDIKVYGEEHSYIAINYNNLGRVYNSMKEYKESLKYYEKSLTILKKVYGDNHERIAMSYCNIGEANVKLENYEQALLYYNQAYEMFIKLLGEEHYTIAVVYLGYGDLYLSQKKYLEALRYLEKSSDLYIKLFNDKYKSLTTVYEKMALCYEGLGDLEKANEYRNKMHL